MLSSRQDIVLDFNRQKHVVILEHAYDVDSRDVMITCMDSGAPFTILDSYSLKMKILTPDNKNLVLTSYGDYPAIEIVDGKALVHFTTGVLLAPGEASAELVIKDGTRVLTTFEVTIQIMEGTFSDDAALDDPYAKTAVAELIEEITGYVDEAEGYKNTTEGYMNTTEGYMNTTQGYMDTTKGYMDTTQGYMVTTQGYKDEAEEARDDAVDAKDAATTSATNAETHANESKSWAIGDNATDHTRTDGSGETNQSSQYYAELSKTNQSGAKSWAIGDNADYTRTEGSGDSNQSAEYYAEKSKESIEEAKSWSVGDNETTHERTAGSGDENQSSQYYAILAKEYKDQAQQIAGGNFATVDPDSGYILDGQIKLISTEQINALFT